MSTPQPQLTLLLQTAAPDGWAALALISPQGAAAELLATEPLPGRASSELLLPAIRTLFRATAREPRELATVIVVAGPGSFTGVRVGMAAAKGLCDSTGAHLLTVSRLHLLASAARHANASPALVLLDAGRGEYYAGTVHHPGQPPAEHLLPPGELDEALNGGTAVTSEPAVEAALGSRVQLLPEPDPPALLRLALPLLRSGQWTDLASADALYLRRTDAELKQAATAPAAS